MPPIETQQLFQKGINDRVSKERGDSTRLNSLKNARLQKRGNTLEVSRIKGFSEISGSTRNYSESTILDSLFYNDKFVVFWYDNSAGGFDFNIDIININDGTFVNKSFFDSFVSYGELTLLEDTIFIAPYQKVLTNVGGTWYLSDFISTTPLVDISNELLGTKSTGSITITGPASTASTGKEGDLDFYIDGSPALIYDVQYGDTKLEIANGLSNYLNTFSTIYESTVDSSGADPVINITALETGTEPNATITEHVNTTSVTYTKQNMTGGTYEAGTLEQDTDYWYKVRYRYYDGHKTKTSYPAYKNTGNHQGIKIDISVEQADLDGGWIDVEIYRKREAEEFFLIEKITPTATTQTYTDDGKPKLSPLTEENYVWTQNNQTQDIVRDRLVKANNEYKNVENNNQYLAQILKETVETGDQGVPYNTDIEVYTQVRRKDGTTTTHKFHETVSTDSDDSKLQIQQSLAYTPSTDFKELASYARFRPKQAPDLIPFKTLEIYNSNVPSMATEEDVEAAQDKPANPHVFLGFKYIRGATNDTDQIAVYDREWNTNPQTANGSTNLYTKQNAITYATDLTDLSFYDEAGSELPYSKVAFADGGTQDEKVYQLAFFDALKEAIANGTCKVRLTGINGVDGSLSSERPDDDFIGREIKVVGLKDTSNESQFQFDVFGVNDTLYYSNYNHLYLILESGTPFDDFDNAGANNSDIKADYETTTPSSFQHRYEFELIGLKEVDNGIASSNVLTNYTTYDYDYRLRLTDYTDFQNDSGVLIYKTDEDTSTFYFTPEIQGWEKTINNKFEFYSINEWNEYSTIVTLDDLEQFQRNYPNQLIWSDSYIQESNASKVRNFPYENSKHISGEYGNIVNIQYINGQLLVFCERGVNIINVGEVLTRQVGGQTFVDSSTLLNNDYWVLKSVPDIKARSIVQYENTLYFSDGEDVWQYADGLQNISNGKITLDIDQSFEGAIDPQNKEYLLTNGTQTYAYSIELQQWQGPYTYAIKTAHEYRNNFYGVVGNNAVEFNTGNTFNGSSYDTVIESVANTLEEPSITKLFRKFYIETDGNATFSYGKEYGTFTDNDLSTKPNKNGVYHVGINGTNKNGRQLFWKITTQVQDFVLSLISFVWSPRKRR